MDDVILPNKIRLRLHDRRYSAPFLVLQVGTVDAGIFSDKTYENVPAKYIHYRDAEVSDLTPQTLELLGIKNVS